MTTKTYTQCKETKPLADFYKQSEAPDGRVTKCIKCLKANEDKKKEQQREYGKKYFTF